MLQAVADTHAILWYLAADPRLSSKAKSFFDTVLHAGDHIAVSSISLAEVVYLEEKGRVPSGTFASVEGAFDILSHFLSEIPFERQIAKAMFQVHRSQVPDFPDRIIAATALYLGVPLITRDAKIQASGITTIW